MIDQVDITLKVEPDVAKWLECQRSLGNLDYIFHDLVFACVETETELDKLAKKAWAGDKKASLEYLRALAGKRSKISKLGEKYNSKADK